MFGAAVLEPGLLPLQGSLFGTAAPSIEPLADRVVRHQLDPCCWVDVAEQWFTGADDLMAELLTRLTWERGRRLMYGTFYDEPRLSASAMVGDSALPTMVNDLATELGVHYRQDFDAVFCNYYRDGRDSVAWHADRVGQRQVDPLVAIICLGGPRPFKMRPMGGGASDSYPLGSGDLLVMGGATQHHWEHAVPKVRFAPPRMSVTIRSGPGSERTPRSMA